MILDAILADTRALLTERRSRVPVEALRQRIAAQPPPLDLCAALRAPGVALVAEIKRASPSKGALNLEMDPAALAARYAAAGADAISVLTEPIRFRGRLDDLAAARVGAQSAHRDVPLLRKDVIVDAYQLLEARAWGADAVLLIVAALDDEVLAALLAEALALGLTPLVEVHDRAELERALAL
ncbi:MAG: indole-3-glycerol phosphate synthase TrpC, partial [Chloroflexota bacterium]